MAPNETNPLALLSEALVEAVSIAGAYTVLVDARRRFPASGVAYSAEYVITADHVIEREEDLRVLLPDGQQINASLVGRDPGSDLALLRLAQPVAQAAVLAEQPARPGQIVLALGRPTSEGIQASLGIVSAIGGPVRTRMGGLLESYLRTDTISYPGFSGGPLVQANGRMLGVNTSGLAHGTAVTIPVSLAWRIAADLAEHGRVRRGYLGVRSQPVQLSAVQRRSLGREQPAGLLIVAVEENSPAEKAGLMVGDILVALAGQPIRDPDELLTMLAGISVGKPAELQVLRAGQLQTFTAEIGTR